jgi:hypothetical protein
MTGVRERAGGVSMTLGGDRRSRNSSSRTLLRELFFENSYDLYVQGKVNPSQVALDTCSISFVDGKG